MRRRARAARRKLTLRWTPPRLARLMSEANVLSELMAELNALRQQVRVAKADRPRVSRTPQSV